MNLIRYLSVMTIRARSVAVIGGGPAGAIATDALVKEQAFDRIRVFERRSVPSGAWFGSRGCGYRDGLTDSGYILHIYLLESLR